MKNLQITLAIGTFLFVATLGHMTLADGKDKKSESVTERFNKLDTNHDGKLSKEEFKKFEPNKHKIGVTKKTSNRDKFIQFDKDNDGSISPLEFRKIFEYRDKK